MKQADYFVIGPKIKAVRNRPGKGSTQAGSILIEEGFGNISIRFEVYWSEKGSLRDGLV